MTALPNTIDKVQFVFCRHTCGQLAHETLVQPQPPLGLLILACFIRQQLPHIDIEVYDGILFDPETLVSLLDAPVVGFSVWFSNYHESCRIANILKERNPCRTIFMGGPHPSWIGERILRNQPAIDYIVRGDGEIAFSRFLRGDDTLRIPGLLFRRDTIIVSGGCDGSWAEELPLDSLPPIDLTLLRPPYQWKSTRGSPGMASFPLSGIRGCHRSRIRCEYCSIPTRGYRVMSPSRYWAEVDFLHQRHGIDYFFETGDTFAPTLLSNFARQKLDCSLTFRVYCFPSINKKKHVRLLKDMGVRMVFMGIESVLHWSNRFKRKYPWYYTIEHLIEEIHWYGKEDISVWPGFLLGLPGETATSLARNLDLIERIAALPNVDEFTTSVVVPLPGSDIFEQSCDNPQIQSEYLNRTGHHLSTHDLIDYGILTELFVAAYTQLTFGELEAFACKNRIGLDLRVHRR